MSANFSADNDDSAEEQVLRDFIESMERSVFVQPMAPPLTANEWTRVLDRLSTIEDIVEANNYHRTPVVYQLLSYAGDMMRYGSAMARGARVLIDNTANLIGCNSLFETQPLDVLAHIFSYLDTRTRYGVLARVSHRFCKVVRERSEQVSFEFDCFADDAFTTQLAHFRRVLGASLLTIVNVRLSARSVHRRKSSAKKCEHHWRQGILQALFDVFPPNLERLSIPMFYMTMYVPDIRSKHTHLFESVDNMLSVQRIPKFTRLRKLELRLYKPLDHSSRIQLFDDMEACGMISGRVVENAWPNLNRWERSEPDSDTVTSLDLLSLHGVKLDQPLSAFVINCTSVDTLELHSCNCGIRNDHRTTFTVDDSYTSLEGLRHLVLVNEDVQKGNGSLLCHCRAARSLPVDEFYVHPTLRHITIDSVNAVPRAIVMQLRAYGFRTSCENREIIEYSQRGRRLLHWTRDPLACEADYNRFTAMARALPEPAKMRRTLARVYGFTIARSLVSAKDMYHAALPHVRAKLHHYIVKHKHWKLRQRQ